MSTPVSIHASRRHALTASGLALAAMLLAPPPASGQNGMPRGAVSPALVDSIRTATERFRDVSVALAEGYVPDPTGMCVDAAMEGLPAQLGSMGIHYFRPDLLGITATDPRVAGTGVHTDFATPSVLVYEPREDGSLELVAVESLVFARPWHDAGNSGPPEFHGNQYYHMNDNPATEPDEAHGFEPHYELHMWIFRDNPNGLFSPFNPNVTCAHATH